MFELYKLTLSERPSRIAATTTAHAPVPQAKVAPISTVIDGKKNVHEWAHVNESCVFKVDD